MIARMKKIFVVCLSGDARQTVSLLRRVGTVHVEHQRVPQSRDISLLEEEVAFASKAIDVLERRCPGNKPALAKKAEDLKAVCQHIIDLDKRLEQLKDFSETLKVRIADWEPWGDFDPEQIEALSRKDIFAGLYQVPVKQIPSLPKDMIVRTVFVRSGIANCVLICSQKKDLGLRQIALPKTSLTAMRRRLEQDTRMEKNILEELSRYGEYAEDILQRKHYSEKELLFYRAFEGMGSSGTLSFLAGYVPADGVTELEQAAHANRWALSVQDPSSEDQVPTLIRSPRWVQTVEPLFKLLGITCGYRELDVSALFLVFFSLFFGILIGDAGYGLVYMLLTWLMRDKLSKQAQGKKALRLFYLISLSAVLWGAATGTFFGQEWLLKKGFGPLVPRLNDIMFMQSFCFFLGAFHLSIAHAWKAFVKAPALSALSEVGWVGVLWSAFFLARTLILGEPFPSWGNNLIALSVALVIFFTNPQKNVFKAVAEGLGAVALSLMNNFTDVVSYVRLFAVGLASVTIAEITNSMAAEFGSGFAVVAGIAILAVGHGLNLVLGPMSVLVHGIRLNVLEFSSHANVAWSGMPYEPLKQ